MFSILTNKLRSLNGHTAVLEACGWDEELVDAAFVDLGDVIKGYGGTSLSSLADHIRKGLRSKKYDDRIIGCLLKLVEIEVQGEMNSIRGEA